MWKTRARRRGMEETGGPEYEEGEAVLMGIMVVVHWV
jgi:hypothetical protein